MALVRFLKYAGLNTAVLPFNIGIAALLTYLGVHYLFATLVGVGLQVTVVFFANRRWTFSAPLIHAYQGLVRTWLVELGSITIVLGTTMYLVELMLIEYTIARLCAVIVAGTWGYLADSYFTFRTNPFR